MSIRIRNISGNPCVAMLSFDAKTEVSEFTLSDSTSGSRLYSDQTVVDVALAGVPRPAEINGYMITTTEEAPAADSLGWSTEAITSYNLDTEGDHTLWGWVRDTAGNVAGKSAKIGYSTTTPTPSGATPYSLMGGIRVDWTTDLDAVGWIRYGTGGAYDHESTTFSYGTSHSITITGLDAPTAYDCQVVCNGVAGPTGSICVGPFTWKTPAAGGSWNTAANWTPAQEPGEGDVAILPNSGSVVHTVTVDLASFAAELRMEQGGAGGNYVQLNNDFTVNKIQLSAPAGTSDPRNSYMRVYVNGHTFTFGNAEPYGTSNHWGMPIPTGTSGGTIIKNGTGTTILCFQSASNFNGEYVVQNGILDLRTGAGQANISAASKLTVISPGVVTVGSGTGHPNAYMLNGHGNGTDTSGAMIAGGGTVVTKPVTLATASTINVPLLTDVARISGNLDGAGECRKKALAR